MNALASLTFVPTSPCTMRSSCWRYQVHWIRTDAGHWLATAMNLPETGYDKQLGQFEHAELHKAQEQAKAACIDHANERRTNGGW